MRVHSFLPCPKSPDLKVHCENSLLEFSRNLRQIATVTISCWWLYDGGDNFGCLKVIFPVTTRSQKFWTFAYGFPIFRRIVMLVTISMVIKLKLVIHIICIRYLSPTSMFHKSLHLNFVLGVPVPYQSRTFPIPISPSAVLISSSSGPRPIRTRITSSWSSTVPV